MTADLSARRRNGRRVILLGGLAVVLLLAIPRAITWWRSGELCPVETTGHGRTPRGLDWTITRSPCGGEVGDVWQVRVIAPGAVSQPIFDARNAPKVLGVEQVGDDTLKLLLDAPPEGAAEASVLVHVDHKGRPADAPRFVNGKRVK